MNKIVWRNIAIGLIVVLLIVYVAWNFDRTTAKDITKEQLITALGETELTEGDRNTLKRYYSLTGDEFEYFVVYTAPGLMNVDEIFIVKGDEQALSLAEQAAKARQQAQLTAFDGYGTDQVARLSAAVFHKQGGYFFYAVGQNADSRLSAFLKAVK